MIVLKWRSFYCLSGPLLITVLIDWLGHPVEIKVKSIYLSIPLSISLDSLHPPSSNQHSCSPSPLASSTSSLVVLASSCPSLQTPMLFSKHAHHPFSTRSRTNNNTWKIYRRYDSYYLPYVYMQLRFEKQARKRLYKAVNTYRFNINKCGMFFFVWMQPLYSVQ